MNSNKNKLLICSLFGSIVSMRPINLFRKLHFKENKWKYKIKS